MPELPEVEVTRRSIDEPLRDARVLGVRLGKPLRWPLGCKPESLVGARIGPVTRRGKYLWLPLLRDRPADPNPSGGLLMHLGMSGALTLSDLPRPAGAHDHFDLETSRGLLRMTDPRRFGAVVWSAGLDLAPAASLLASLGPEPFDPLLTPASFHAALHARRSPIKAVLLSGEVVVGAGNIYACEALFRAGIDPRLRAHLISRPRAARLLQEIRATLAQALALGGSTLRDFHDAHGMNGEFQASAAVYGREGLACPVCGSPVRRITQMQRSTFFCGRCQRR